MIGDGSCRISPGSRTSAAILSRPLWTGEDIRRKTILIYTEQGLGDIILFARYLRLVIAKAGRVIVAANPAMRRFWEQSTGCRSSRSAKSPLPDFDVRCPLISLPRVFATRLDSIPNRRCRISACRSRRTGALGQPDQRRHAQGAG